MSGVSTKKLRAWRRGDGYPFAHHDADFSPPTCSYCGATITISEFTDQLGSPVGSVKTGVWVCDRCRGQA